MDEQSPGHRGSHTMQKGRKSKTSGSSQSGGAPRAANQKARKPKRQPDLVEAAPLAIGRQVRTRAPDVSASVGGDGRVRIRHREYIADVLGSVAFAAVSYPVNPGLPTTFPWLSTMAVLFESFIFKGLRFIIETQKSASTNGTVMMSIDFDAADAVPASKQQLMTYNGAVRSAVWQECVYRSAPQNLVKFGPRKFVRSAALAANLDIKTYDVGTLFVATQGCVDTSAIGELYVEYDIELETPQQLAPSALVPGAGFSNPSATAAAPFTGATPWSNGSLAISGSGTTMTVTGATIGQEYLIWGGGTAVAGAGLFAVSALSGATLKNSMLLGTGGWVTCTATAGTFTFTLTLSGTHTNVLFTVQAVPTLPF